jgi:glutamate racemase
VKSGLATSRERAGVLHLMATDSPERFARVGARFLGSSIAVRSVDAIDL